MADRNWQILKNETPRVMGCPAITSPLMSSNERETKMPTLYRNESSYPKNNAQRNLAGRTHYVDDDTLRGFHSRVISARETDGGLLFAIVTSDAKDYQNRARGFRYVIFDLFGTVVERNPGNMENPFFRTNEQATKAMWKAVNALDASAITRAGIERAEKQHASEMDRLRGDVERLVAENKTKAA